MLVKIGINKYLSRRSRWKEECFEQYGLWPDGRNMLRLKGVYKRSFWDWCARRRRVPVSVAEQLLQQGIIGEYIPVPTLDIALIKCNATIYGIYMDYVGA